MEVAHDGLEGCVYFDRAEIFQPSGSHDGLARWKERKMRDVSCDVDGYLQPLLRVL